MAKDGILLPSSSTIMDFQCRRFREIYAPINIKPEGGRGRVGILTLSKDYQNPGHPGAKNNCQKYQ